MRLAGFTRITLEPGGSRRVTLTAEPRIVADYDTKLPGWRIAGDATVSCSRTMRPTVRWSWPRRSTARR